MERPSRFDTMPGDMRIPPRHLYPTRPVPTLWRVVLEVETTTWTWESYASTSTDATMLALSWLRDLLLENESLHAEQKIRVLEVLQVAV